MRPYIIFVLCIYMSYHILFEGAYFVLSYSTHIWNTHVAGNLLRIKKREK